MKVQESGSQLYPVELILCGTAHLLSRQDAIQIADELLKVANEHGKKS